MKKIITTPMGNTFDVSKICSVSSVKDFNTNFTIEVYLEANCMMMISVDYPVDSYQDKNSARDRIKKERASIVDAMSSIDDATPERIIDVMEGARQGFSTMIIRSVTQKDKLTAISLRANHVQLNKMIVQLGGEDVSPPSFKDSDFED